MNPQFAPVFDANSLKFLDKPFLLRADHIDQRIVGQYAKFDFIHVVTAIPCSIFHRPSLHPAPRGYAQDAKVAEKIIFFLGR
jgi:hypothetical protein